MCTYSESDRTKKEEKLKEKKMKEKKEKEGTKEGRQVNLSDKKNFSESVIFSLEN